MDIEKVNPSIKKAKERFTKVANFILSDTNLTDGEFRTYVTLKSYKIAGGEVFPSLTTLARERGKSKRVISEHAKALRDKGYIKTKRRGFSGSNLYYFIREENSTNVSKPMVKNGVSLVQKTSPQTRSILPPNKTEFNKTDSNNFEKTSSMAYEKLRDIVGHIRHQK